LTKLRKIRIRAGVTGEELKALRKRLEMTQAELARKLKKNVMTISYWERGAGDIPYAIELALKEIERQYK
jgi:DNA-binding transcriptional regulator YiaG